MGHLSNREYVMLVYIFMKRIRLLFIVMTGVVTHSFGQIDVPKYFCQGCCGGVGEYYLKLDSRNKFEVYYLIVNTENNSVFGLGTYSIENDVLELSFENIPQDGIELRRINTSDSLIIHFYTVDNVRGDSVFMVNVKFKGGKSFFYPHTTGKIRTVFKRRQVIIFSSLGFKDIICSLAEPGEYEIRVKFNPEGKTYFKEGEKKEFRIVREKNLEWFEGIENKKLKFTTKSCEF